MSATAVAARPADAPECASLLAEASASERSVAIVGGGSKRYIGDVRATDVELSTRRMRGIVDHVAADLTVTVAGGTPFAEVQTSLGAAGQFLSLDPPHADVATIGGIIAANSNGFWRTRYGGVRDLLIGTRIALADGTVARSGGRVVKNVAGYDLNKLVTGSFGTLGVIVEATFKVLPVPPEAAGRVARFARGSDAFAAADALLRSAARPAALAVARASDGWHLIVSARGTQPVVARALSETQREVAARNGTLEDLATELDDLRELPARADTGALVRVALPLAAQATFAETASRLESFVALAADAAAAVHRVHLDGDPERVVADADALILAARMVGGSARIERRADALRDRLATWPASPQGAAMMRRIKDEFDPKGVLEPGRAGLVG